MWEYTFRLCKYFGTPQNFIILVSGHTWINSYYDGCQMVFFPPNSSFLLIFISWLSTTRKSPFFSFLSVLESWVIILHKFIVFYCQYLFWHSNFLRFSQWKFFKLLLSRSEHSLNISSLFGSRCSRLVLHAISAVESGVP